MPKRFFVDWLGKFDTSHPGFAVADLVMVNHPPQLALCQVRIAGCAGLTKVSTLGESASMTPSSSKAPRCKAPPRKSTWKPNCCKR